MFFPTSPSPPSGMILQTPIDRRSLGGGRAEDAAAFEAAPDGVELLLARVDHREAEAADLMARQVERALDGDRVRLDPQELVGRPQGLVRLPRAVDVAVAEAADHLLDLEAPDVRDHGD